MNYKNCEVAKYHRMTVISSPYQERGDEKPYSPDQVEVCIACKQRKSYAFTPEGRMVDQNAYFLDHIRDFCQPSMGEIYAECNPEGIKKFNLEALEKKQQEDKNAEQSDKFRFAIKRALDDRDDGITNKK